MRKVSAWVAIAAVPTMIAGVYGMNFEHMPELRQTWGYPAALTLIACICVLLYRTFRHNHLLWPPANPNSRTDVESTPYGPKGSAYQPCSAIHAMVTPSITAHDCRGALCRSRCLWR